MRELRFTQVGLVYGFSFALGMIWFDSVETVETVTVVVATQDIPPGTRLNRPGNWLTLKEYIKGTEPPTAADAVEVFQGEMAAQWIRKGQPFTHRDVVRSIDIVSRPSPFRAVTVRIRGAFPEHFSLPGLLRVDVLFTLVDPDGGPKAVTLVENAMILAVNAPRTAGDPFFSVTLAVRPEDGRKLYEVRSQGTLALTIRRPGDDAIMHPKPLDGFFPLVAESDSSVAPK